MQGIDNQRAPADATIMAGLLAARLAFLLLSPTGLSGDAFGYVQDAETIINTGKLPPLTAQPLGYPILIAPLLFASGHGFARAVLVMNSILDCAVIAILLHCAQRIFPRADQKRARLLCWLVATIQPFTTVVINNAVTEGPVMFLEFVGIWLLFLPSRFVWTRCGLALLGFASLLRIDILVLNAISVVIYFVFFGGVKYSITACIKGCFVFLMFPGLMLTYQFYSTQEFGFISYKPSTPGYDIWTRSWFALQKSEYERLAWDVGSRDWFGFDVSNYPARAFDSTAERDRVSGLLTIWRSTGYSASIDQGFESLGHDKFVQHPVRSFLLVPFLRMAHFWINIDGAEPYFRVLVMQRPFSTLFVACTLLLRLLLIFFAGLGAYKIWFWPQASVPEQLSLARFGSLFAVLRTMELGALGAIVQRGLMENRYVLVAFPFIILLSFWGVRFLLEASTYRARNAKRDELIKPRNEYEAMADYRPFRNHREVEL
jgi:hypothetical protein